MLRVQTEKLRDIQPVSLCFKLNTISSQITYEQVTAHSDIVLVHTAFMVPLMEYISQDFLK